MKDLFNSVVAYLTDNTWVVVTIQGIFLLWWGLRPIKKAPGSAHEVPKVYLDGEPVDPANLSLAHHILLLMDKPSKWARTPHGGHDSGKTDSWEEFLKATDDVEEQADKSAINLLCESHDFEIRGYWSEPVPFVKQYHINLLYPTKNGTDITKSIEPRLLKKIGKKAVQLQKDVERLQAENKAKELNDKFINQPALAANTGIPTKEDQLFDMPKLPDQQPTAIPPLENPVLQWLGKDSKGIDHYAAEKVKNPYPKPSITPLKNPVPKKAEDKGKESRRVSLPRYSAIGERFYFDFKDLVGIVEYPAYTKLTFNDGMARCVDYAALPFQAVLEKIAKAYYSNLVCQCDTCVTVKREIEEATPSTTLSDPFITLPVLLGKDYRGPVWQKFRKEEIVKLTVDPTDMKNTIVSLSTGTLAVVNSTSHKYIAEQLGWSGICNCGYNAANCKSCGECPPSQKPVSCSYCGKQADMRWREQDQDQFFCSMVCLFQHKNDSEATKFREELMEKEAQEVQFCTEARSQAVVFTHDDGTPIAFGIREVSSVAVKDGNVTIYCGTAYWIIQESKEVALATLREAGWTGCWCGNACKTEFCSEHCAWAANLSQKSHEAANEAERLAAEVAKAKKFKPGEMFITVEGRKVVIQEEAIHQYQSYGGGTLITMKDNGRYIAEESVNTIFDRRMQAKGVWKS